MAWTLTAGGTDIITRVSRGSLRIQQRAYRSAAVMTFEVEDFGKTVTVSPEQEIILTEDGTRRFAGHVKGRVRSHRGHTLSRVYDITCADYSALLDLDVVSSPSVRSTAESDKARISWLMSTFGSHGITYSALVTQYVASMPEQDFTGMTLRESLTQIAKYSWARFYVDFNKELVFTKTANAVAGFNLSDTPNGTTTFGYEEFQLEEDTTELINAVYVLGEGVGLWREDATSIATYGRREMVLNDAEIKDTATANTRGDALLAGRKDPKLSGTVTIRRPGVNAGNSIQITNSGWGISAQTFTVTGVDTSWEDWHSEALYQLAFGGAATSLADTLGGIAGTAHDALQMAQATGALEPVADLSVAGANLVPNSSFESGSGGNWTVGSNWVVNYVSALPQEDAITGTKVARVALASQAAGDLITPYINVARADDYWISAWSYLTSRTSGTAVIEVQEFSAAGALLATNTIASLTAAEAAWTRHSLRFGPNDSYGRTAWNASTAKVRIRLRSLSGTLTWEVDGVQFERGKLLTAYAPAPQELVDGSITSAQMADLSVTLAKLAADSVDNSKLVNDAVNAAKIATGAIGITELSDGAITTAKLVDNAVNAAKIAIGAVGTTEISDGAVTTAKVVALAIDAGKIAADAVTADKIAANAVTTVKLNALAVTAAEIAASAVIADKIAANAVTTTKLDALAVTAAKIAANAIIAEKIAAGAVEADKIAANAIVAGKIAAGVVTATELAANAVTADKILAGAIRAQHLLVTADRSNLLLNGGFEESLAGADAYGTVNVFPGWTTSTSSGELIRRLTSSSAGGAWILGIKSADGLGSNRGVYQETPVTAGRRYRLRGRAWKGATGGTNVQILAHSYDAAGAAVAFNVLIAVDAVGSTTPITGEAYYTVPLGVATLRTFCRWGGTPGTTEIFAFDDVQLELLPQGAQNSTGEVKVDNTGITISNGAMTVTSPGGTVIIDGTSDMFRIAASGTMARLGTATAVDAFTSVNVTVAGSTGTLACIAAVGNDAIPGDRRSIGPFIVEDIRYMASVSGGATTSRMIALISFAEVSNNYIGSGVQQARLLVSNASDTAIDRYARWYMLKQTAI